MKGNPEERAVALALYITENNATVRTAAAAFGVSKSTVHKDVTRTLYKINRPLYEAVQKVLRQNKEERHLRGGEATRRKYLERQGLPIKPAAGARAGRVGQNYDSVY